MNLPKQKIILAFRKTKNYFVNFFVFVKKYISSTRDATRTFRSSDHDKKLVFSLSGSKIPNLKQLKYIGNFLDKNEKRIIVIVGVILILNSIFLLGNFYVKHLQLVPAYSGAYVEGVVGGPTHLNPLYSRARDVDNDISHLIFSGLMKHGKNGELVKDLTEDYSVSEDGKSYTFVLRENLEWHDGADLIADDVIFTFNAIKNPRYKSVLYSSLNGVVIEKLNDRTIRFVLNEPYVAFPEILTFKIMPEKLWQQISPESASLAELNIKPVGSGSYKFKSLVKDKAGNIKEYKLVANDNYYDKSPFIEEFTLKFYPKFEELLAALNNNQVDGIAYLPMQYRSMIIAQNSLNFQRLQLPQITSVFFNVTNVALKNQKVRQALAYALDKPAMVAQVFGPDADVADGPILKTSFAYDDGLVRYDYDTGKARSLVEEAGWKMENINEEMLESLRDKPSEDLKDAEKAKLAIGAGDWFIKDGKYLTINFVTINLEQNIAMAEMIQDAWEAVGVKVNLNIVGVNQVQSDIIRPRSFDAILYGLMLGADPDLYVFWHSTQATERGLNISNYSNKDVDKILEESRKSADQDFRKEQYKKFQEIITTEVPAIFMYSPNYNYVQSKKIKGFETTFAVSPADRFSDVGSWYIKTQKKLIW